MPCVITSVKDSPPSFSISAWKGLAVVVIVLAGTIFLSVASPISAQSPEDLERQRAAAKQQQKLGEKLWEEQLEALKRQAADLRGKQQELRQAVREKSGLSPENVTPILLGLERDQFALEIEVVLKTVRRKNLEELVAKETKQGRQRANADEIVERLNKIVAARREALSLQQERTKAAAASILDVKNAEADLAEAEIRLLVRREELGKTHEDAAVDRLNQQLLEMSVELAQDELRLQVLKEKLRSLVDVQNLLDEYKNATESELPRVLRMLDKAETELAGVKLLN